ncbi:hypothetical protein [Carboxylicivirga taeanensis]|uniref:hypothetical protein n=1 Tax=Carboxylicivirga taeanensis TaxID=1416875 RepID=UPI003F6E0892
MKTTFLILSLLVFSVNTFSQDTPEKIIEDFFTTYGKNKPDKAIDNLYTYSPWLNSEADVVIKLKTQFRDLKQLVGEYNGYQLLTKKSLGDCFELYVFLVKYDRQPFRFTFEFYKPKDKWITYSFSYDYDLDDDLEEAAKFDLLKDE